MKSRALIILFFSTRFAFAIDTPSNCRVGDNWTKRAPTQDDIRDPNSSTRKAVLATGAYGGGTAFYLGKFNGHHLAATNYHVVKDTPCIFFDDMPGLHPHPNTVDFESLGVSAECVQYLAGKTLKGWDDIEFALIEIKPSALDEIKLKEVGLNVAFSKPLIQGTPLVTAGHGIAGNYQSKLQFTDDSDCKVFSKTDEFKFMADPDTKTPSSYNTWSFAHGCDGSHGDSGSALLNKSTGEIVGLLWTGMLPKSKEAQNSKELSGMISNNDAKIWTELNYGVPAAKIHEKMKSVILTGLLPKDTLKTIQSWIDGARDP